MIVYDNIYASKEQLDADVASYRQAMEQHKLTVDEPAPFPPNEIVEQIVKGDIAYTWEALPKQTATQSSIAIEGYEHVSDMYNEFLLKQHQFSELLEYQQKRALEYPAIGDQLDALFKAGIFPDDMMDAIRLVKNKYPKPQPYASWIWDSVTCQWGAPESYPTDGKQYIWDENTTSWIEVE